MTMQEALALIAQKLAQAEALVSECETIAQENDVEFSVNFGGYGMGGTFGPAYNSWESSDWENSDEEVSAPEYEWHASSQSC